VPNDVGFAASLNVSAIESQFSTRPTVPPLEFARVIAVARKRFKVKLALAPVRRGAPPLAEIVSFVAYGPVIVTLCVSEPFVKVPVAGTMEPKALERFTTPLKPVTVELSWASAVMVTLKAAPECCVAMALKVKWSRGFAQT
jgi:hypothetical protein